MISLKKLLKESDDSPDMFGTADKRIGPETKKGFSPTPVFKQSSNGDGDDNAAKSDTDQMLDIIPLEETGNTIKVSKADRENPRFLSGVKIAVQDRDNEEKRNLSGYDPDFIRGYKIVKRSSWWDKTNAWLTQKAADLGSSYGPR